MKKKCIIALFTALIFSLILTTQVSGQTKFGTRTESFLKIFASGNYHMKASVTEDGVKSDMEVFAKDGKIASIITSQGETIRMVLRDNKTYLIMDSVKMILVTPMQDTSEAGAVDTSKMSFTGSGTANFAGKNLPYEEYTEDHEKSQFFIDGSKLAGIRSIIAGGKPTDTVISILDQNVQDSAFTVPSSGYQIQDMSGFNF